jgi:voltage-gated potassium channel
MESKFDSKLSSLVLSNRFELFVGLLTLSSVVLALVFYIPEIPLSIDQINAIYIFDLAVVAVLAFDFCIRAKNSKDGRRYVITHCYEIPAMIPLIVFAFFEDPLFLGAAVRSIRFIRLLRLIRLFRLANLFRTAYYWKLSTFLYLIIILAASITFGSIAILSVEEEANGNIKNFGDAVWFSVTTLTISGFGDVYPSTTAGRVIAAILSFIGLGIILGFISNIGSALVASRLGKTQKRLHDETKNLILNRINNIEQLHEEELADLIMLINTLHKGRKVNSSAACICSSCRNTCLTGSIYCNKCGIKI